MAEKPKVDKVEVTKRLMAALMRMEPQQQATTEVRKTVPQKQAEVPAKKNDFDEMPWMIEPKHPKR